MCRMIVLLTLLASPPDIVPRGRQTPNDLLAVGGPTASSNDLLGLTPYPMEKVVDSARSLRSGSGTAPTVRGATACPSKTMGKRGRVLGFVRRTGRSQR